jgi:hypothetical protein
MANISPGMQVLHGVPRYRSEEAAEAQAPAAAWVHHPISCTCQISYLCSTETSPAILQEICNGSGLLFL